MKFLLNVSFCPIRLLSSVIFMTRNWTNLDYSVKSDVLQCIKTFTHDLNIFLTSQILAVSRTQRIATAQLRPLPLRRDLLEVGGTVRHSASEAGWLFKLDSRAEDSFVRRDNVA